MAVKAKYKTRKFANALLWVLLVLLFLGALLGLVRCNTGNLTQTLLLKSGNWTLKENTPITIFVSMSCRIDVSDALGNALSDGSYSVKIVARTTGNENVYFKIGDTTQTMKDLPELTEYLLEEQGDGYFVLKLTLDFPEILQDMYSEFNVTNVPSFQSVATPLLNLVVTSSNGKASVIVPLSVAILTSDATDIIF